MIKLLSKIIFEEYRQPDYLIYCVNKAYIFIFINLLFG